MGGVAIMRRARAAFCGRRRKITTVAARSAKTLPSDPEYLLFLMFQIGEDSKSDDDFDGWLDDDHRERDDETGSAPPADVQCHQSRWTLLTHVTQSSLSPLAHTFVSPPIIIIIIIM